MGLTGRQYKTCASAGVHAAAVPDRRTTAARTRKHAQGYGAALWSEAAEAAVAAKAAEGEGVATQTQHCMKARSGMHRAEV